MREPSDSELLADTALALSRIVAIWATRTDPVAAGDHIERLANQALADLDSTRGVPCPVVNLDTRRRPRSSGTSSPA